MFRYHTYVLGCLTLLSCGLFAATDNPKTSQKTYQKKKEEDSYKREVNYKLGIIKGISKALAKNTPVSPDAKRSAGDPAKNASSSDKKQKGGCGKGACRARVITSSDINPNGFVITQPGVYRLKRNTVFKPSAPGLSAIVIDSDNVTLDLCEKVLSQNNATAGTIGILVNPHQNVTIENGTVEGFKLFGIRANAGTTAGSETSYLYLRKLNVLGNGLDDPTNLTLSGGIVINSALPTAITHDIVIDEVNSSKNFTAGLILSGVTNVDVKQSKFNNNVSATLGYGINAWGALATSFFLAGNNNPNSSFLPCSDLNFFDCETNSNTGTGGTVGLDILSVIAFGFEFNNYVTIERCVANSNKGGGNTSPGVVNEGEGIVVTGTQNFLVKDCTANGNGTLATGPSGIPGFFASTGFGVPFDGVNGVFENCVAQGNSGAGDSSQGFRILRSSNISILNCVAIGNNNSSTGEAWGFTTDPNLGNTLGEFDAPINNNFLFKNCVAEANTSTNGTLCGGFKFISQVNSVLAYCKSISNGSTTKGNGYGIYVADPDCCFTAPNSCCTVDNSVCISPTGCTTPGSCCPTSRNVINNNEVVDNTFVGIKDHANSSAHNAYYANVARGNGALNNYDIPTLPGNPIRTWTLPGFPNTTDNNGILDAQLDNISINP